MENCDAFGEKLFFQAGLSLADAFVDRVKNVQRFQCVRSMEHKSAFGFECGMNDLFFYFITQLFLIFY